MIIPAYPAPEGPLTGTESIAGYADGKTRSISVESIARHTDDAIKPLLADGTRTPEADIPFGGKRLTGLGDATESGDAVPIGQMGRNGGTIVGVADPARPIGNRTRSLITVSQDNGYDMTSDILKARTSPSYAGDQDVMNTILAQQVNVSWNPLVGFIDARAPILAPLPNARIVSLGGKQCAPIVRDPAHTGHTLQVGGPGYGGGGVLLENLFLTHAGRIGYTGAGTLPGVLLKNNQTHLQVHRAQGGIIRNCGGWGAVHLMRFFDCNIVTISDPFSYGGVWDRSYAAAQEAVSVINLGTGPDGGRNTSIVVIGGALYGASVGTRTRTIGDKTVTAPERAGPLAGILINSCEDWTVKGVLIASMAEAGVKWAPDSARAYNVNGIIEGSNIDESNVDCISVFRGDASFSIPDGLTIKGNTLNGQIVAQHALSVYNGPSSINSLLDLRFVDNVVRAVLSCGIQCFGLQGATFRGNSIRGYNMAYSNSIGQAAGVVLAGTSSSIDLSDNRIGGGINSYSDSGTPDANGLSANGCQYGVYRGPNLTDITGARLHQMPFGKTGGAFLARLLNDGATYTFDPSAVFDAPTFAG